MILPILMVAPSGERGRGVFTTEPIESQTIVEISPVLVFDTDDRAKAEETLLYDYILNGGRIRKKELWGWGIFPSTIIPISPIAGMIWISTNN